MIAILASLLMVYGNVRIRQHEQYREGVAGEQAGSFMKGLTGYESAIRMYTPFSSTVERSAQRIWAMAEDAEKRNNPPQALAAYRSLRSAFYATRWLAQPGGRWIERCDRKIAVLVPLAERSAP